jgi:DegV family protein with EDD domain
MEKIGIIACEGADLPPWFIQKHHTEVVKYPVYFLDKEGEEEKIEDTRALYQKMRIEKKFPITSQPSPSDFEDVYEMALKNFQEVLVVTMAKELSRCIASAEIAKKEMLPEEQRRIEIFDSRFATVGEGLIVFRAQELIDQGKEMPELLNELSEFVNQVKLFGFAEDINWLVRGGRLYGLKAEAALALQKTGTRPAITMKDGEPVGTGMKWFAKDRIKAILKELEKAAKKAKIKVAVGQADISNKELSGLTEGIRKLNAEVLFVSDLTPLVGAHIGPGTIVVAYYKE